MTGAIGEHLSQLFVEIGEAYDIDITELHVAPDHVHIYCSFPPRLAISEAVTILKSHSARAVFRVFPELRTRMYGGKLWEDGYFARTVGDTLTGAIIQRYIRNHRDEQPFDEQADSQLDLFQ